MLESQLTYLNIHVPSRARSTRRALFSRTGMTGAGTARREPTHCRSTSYNSAISTALSNSITASSVICGRCPSASS